jgi:hypothetical protein
MILDAQRADLFDAAQTVVKRLVQERGGFTAFAIVQLRDGVTSTIQLSQSSPDPSAALATLLERLLPLAHAAHIQASIVCAPFEVRGELGAVYDLEVSGAGRVLALAPMRKESSGRWSFGEPQLRNAVPRVFAAEGRTAAPVT